MKTRRGFKDLTWFGSVPISTGITVQTFTITEIWLHRKVIIITLNMTNFFF